jgi:hypothetical protein
MFEPRLRESVLLIDRTLEEMIWRVVSRYAQLAGRPPAVAAGVAYGMLDGLFQQALLAYGEGGEQGEATLGGLSTAVESVLPTLLAPAA